MTDRNTTFARTLMAALAASGVEHACVCPGSRNSPLSLALADSAIDDSSHLDERSAAFYALGVAAVTGRPVLVVTTSGTAAAELHPAIVEADAAGVPIIAITADRPTELFDVAAPQAIEQRNLYGTAVRWAHDFDVPDPADAGPERIASVAAHLVAAASGAHPGPVHLNVRMRQPLVIGDEPAPDVVVPTVSRARLAPDPAAVDEWATQMSGRHGVIVAGPQTDRGAAPDVARLGAGLGWPIMTDPLSGLRSGDGVPTAVGSDLLAAAGWLDLATPEVILRIGNPPTSKTLATWMERHRSTPQLVVAPHGWPDPGATSSSMIRSDPGLAARALTGAAPEPAPAEWLEQWRAADTAAAAAADAVIAASPFPNEPAIVASVAAALPEESCLWVASSMPIRDVDSFFPVGGSAVDIRANRGANGIDGTMSSALGAASMGRPTVALVGDIAFIHDVGALAAMARHEIPLSVVAVNNDGGGIFHLLPVEGHRHFERHFGTPHGLSLHRITAGFGLEAAEAVGADDVSRVVAAAGTRPQVIEVRTNREENAALHRRIADEVRRALGRLSATAPHST